MSRGDFWSKSHPDRKKRAPFRLNDLISGRRFEDITKALSYASEKASTYKDRFWEVIQMITEWNRNMQEIFASG